MQATTTISSAQRIRSIDMLRGIVMLIMAIDHVRDFFHITAITADPLDLKITTPVLFFTRWITHFCAPVFVFLSGTSAYLASRRKTAKEASSFLFKRGVWLILVELIVITLALTFNPFYNVLILQVIWAIGCSMIILSLLLYTNIRVILILGFLLVIGHNIFDYISFPQNSASNIIMSALFTNNQRFLPINSSHFVLVFYTILPWTGIMLLGYAFGSVYKQGINATTNKKIFWIGASVTVVFIVIRFINQYGDPSHWSVQKDGLYTLLSFVNTSKYPPSLLYTCMTIGPTLILLSGLESLQKGFSRIVSVYGRVPFFYYVCHFYLIHTICVIMFYASGFGSKDITNPNVPFLFRPTNFGVSLPYVYIIWFCVIAVLYKPCKWFDMYRNSHKQWWLSYL